jgi:creatinine amidohydrolase
MRGRNKSSRLYKRGENMDSSFIRETMLEMTWIEIKEAAEHDAIVLFPIGVVEEHGPHLTVSADIYLSYLVAREARKYLKQQGKESIIAPPFYWGINGTTVKFPGSFVVTKQTMTAMLIELHMSLKNWGFKKIVDIPGHGETDHLLAIEDALKVVYEKTGEGAYMVLPTFMADKAGVKKSPYTVLVDVPELSGGDPDSYLDIHAGALEVSPMLHFFPDIVNTEILKTLKPTRVTLKDYRLWEEGGEFFDRTSPQGYAGDPASANPELGRIMIEQFVEESVKIMMDKLR